MACKPYPSWRFPGWNRLGAALHLDDYHTFYESPKGGLPLPERYHLPGPGVRPKITDTFGCGVDFQNRSLFFTYNGTRIDAPYRVVYPAAIPSDNSALGTDVVQGRYDVFAAIGVQGKSQFEVNFGSKAFAWREGNRPEWRLENHISNGEPPRYAEI
jgi:Ran-binding protein 9/10